MPQLRGASVRLLHNPERAQIERLLDRLAEAGCNAISVIPHHYLNLAPGTPKLAPPPPSWVLPYFIFPDIGQDPNHPFHNTPDPALTWFVCKLARSRGFHVLLKPHVDSYYADWRGNISVRDCAADWAYAYKQRFLRPYADIAAQLDLDLCLGTELYTVTKELGVEFWIGVVDWVRRIGFKGPLTYAANWGWEMDAEYNRLAELWPHLDYLGVDAYFPLAPADYPAVLTADLVAGQGDPDRVGWHRRGIAADWCPRIDEDLLAGSCRAGIPLLFTEIGYGNWWGCLTNPAADPPPDAVPDPVKASWGTLAFARRWRGEGRVAGWYWWEAWLDGPAPAVSHDLLDKPYAAAVWAP